LIEFQVGGKDYKAGKLSLFDQMVVTKRLIPAMGSFVTPELWDAYQASKADQGSLKLNVASIIPSVADAIGNLKDEDAERIIKTCLKVVVRKNDNTGGVYSPVIFGGNVAFDDITLPQMLEIVWKVVEEHMGDFFSTAP
jgi:hypothetical protein